MPAATQTSILKLVNAGPGSFKVLAAQGTIEVRQGNGDSVYYSTFPVTVSLSNAATSVAVKGDVTQMDCSTLSMYQLDAHRHATLQSLNVNACNLSALLIYGCANLEQLFCQGNKLFSIGATDLPSLNHLNAA